MNRATIVLLALAAYSVPLTASAVPLSACTFETVMAGTDEVPEYYDVTTCDLYESDLSGADSSIEIALDFFVGPGVVGIEEFPSGPLRDVLEFVEQYNADDDSYSYFLRFFVNGTDSWATAPNVASNRRIPRGGDKTVYQTPFINPNVFNTYTIYHDFRAAVPEPGSLALLGLGLVGLGLARRRKSK